MKVYLDGKSPDAWDAFMMNEVFYLDFDDVEVSFS